MALQRQIVPLPFGRGINTKSDPFQVPPGELLELENAQFTKSGKLIKRFGYEVLGTVVEGGTANVSEAVAIASFNDELLLFDGTSAFAYVPATGNWIDRGTAISVIATDTAIVRNNAQQKNPDVAIWNGVAAYAWEDSRGGVRYSIVDQATGTFLLADTVINAVASRPKLVVFNNVIVLTYMNGINAFYRIINPRNPTVLGPETALHTDAFSASNCPYDVCVIAGRMFVLYMSSDNSIKVYYVDTSWNVSHAVYVASNGFNSIVYAVGYTQCVSIVADDSENLWLLWSNGYDVYQVLSNYNLTFPSTAYGQILGVSGSSQQVKAITGAVSSGAMTLFYETASPLSGSGDINELVMTNQLLSSIPGTGSYTYPGSQVFLRSVGLASKAFQFSDETYVNVAYGGAVPIGTAIVQPLQQTYFTAHSNGSIVAKVQAGTGGGLRTNTLLSEVPQPTPGDFTYANLVKGATIAQGNTLFSQTGVSSTAISFAPSNQFITAVQSNNLFVVGGVLQSYDGVSFTEHGFHLYPEGISGSFVSTGSVGVTGSLEVGKAYQWFVTYEWPDNFGQVQRSAPSVALSATPVSGGLKAMQLTIPTLRLTAKQGLRTPPRIVVYRTQGNQNIPSRVTSATAPLLNDASSDSVTFIDTMSDAQIIGNEQLYTGNGQANSVLANDAPRACTLITTYKNRVFISGLEDPNLIWFSKTKTDNTNANTIPAEFSSFLTIGVDAAGGKISGLAAMDSNLIIFKENRIYFIAGNGPNNTGGGGDYGDPQVITSDVGCINANSIVETPLGLMFLSSKGLYLLSRSLQATYKGSPVEGFNGYTITSATLHAAYNQVIFTTTNGPALVFDYFHDQWATWTNHQSIDSDIFQGNFCFAKPTGEVYVQTPGSYTDGASPVYMKWTTANLSFAGLQGYQAVWRFYILGNYQGPHTLNVSVATDFNDAYTQNVIVPATRVVGQNLWGGDAFWGGSTPWGGSYAQYEFRIDLKQIRCSSVRISATDQQTLASGSYNEGYEVSGLLFEVGTITGGNRLPATSVFGTS